MIGKGYEWGCVVGISDPFQYAILIGGNHTFFRAKLELFQPVEIAFFAGRSASPSAQTLQQGHKSRVLLADNLIEDNTICNRAIIDNGL
jgi:hypothetical protein